MDDHSDATRTSSADSPVPDAERGDDDRQLCFGDLIERPKEAISGLFITVLRDIYHDPEAGGLRLAQGRISYSEPADTFDQLRDLILGLRYPKPQSSKAETYGWVPALYDQSERRFKNGTTKVGNWRRGSAEHY
jgi:hypothetical protein